MTTSCPSCGSEMRPDQPICADCGFRRGAKPPARRSETAVASGAAPGETPNRAPENTSPSGPTGPRKPTAIRPGATNRRAPGGSGSRRSELGKIARDKERDRRLVGQVVAGKYRILEVLGQGGFGSVFLVEMTEGILRDRLAMKVLPEKFGENKLLRDQFVNEIRVAMKMVDKYIVQIRDVGTTETGLLYYTMDYVPGKTLAEVLRVEGRLSAPRTLRIALRVLRALETAHAMGIIHRDLKPANIMVQVQEGKETVRVLDFGIATATGARSSGQKGFSGSPYYMPPEQFLGTDMGFYTDLYSVGVLLYECLTGRRPYTGSTPQEIYDGIKAGPPVPVETIVPEVKSYAGLAEIVMRALERNPQKRFQSAKEFFEQVNNVLVGNRSGGQGTGAGSGDAEATASARAAGARRRGGRRIPGRSPVARALGRTGPVTDRTGARRSPLGAIVAATIILTLVALGVVFRDDVLKALQQAGIDTTAIERNAGGQVAPAGSGPKATPEETGGASPAEDPTPKPEPRRVRPEDGSSDVDIPGGTQTARAAVKSYVDRFITDGQEALREGDGTKALEHAAEAIDLDPQNATAWRLRGTAYLRLGQFEEAIAAIEKARSYSVAESTALDLLLLLADAYRGLDDPPSAKIEGLLLEAFEKHKSPRAARELVALYEKTGSAAKVEEVVRKAHEDPAIEDAEIDRLFQEIFVERPKKEAAALEKLAKEAKAAFERGDYESAAKAARVVVKRSANLELELLLAESLTKLGDLDGAAEATGRITTLLEKPEGPQVEDSFRRRVALLKGRNAYLGYLRTQNKDLLTEAELELSRLIDALDRRAEPELHALARTYRGCVYAIGADLERVAREFRATIGDRQIEVVQLQALTYFQLARRLKRKEAKADAFELARGRFLTLTKIADLPPDVERSAQFHLGLCYYYLGVMKNDDDGLLRKAVNRFADARDAGMSSADVYEYLGDTYRRLVNFIQAASCYRTAYDVSPNPRRCLLAAEYYLRANPRSPQAKEVLEDGLKRFPDNTEIQNRLLELTR